MCACWDIFACSSHMCSWHLYISCSFSLNFFRYFLICGVFGCTLCFLGFSFLVWLLSGRPDCGRFWCCRTTLVNSSSSMAAPFDGVLCDTGTCPDFVGRSSIGLFGTDSCRLQQLAFSSFLLSLYIHLSHRWKWCKIQAFVAFSVIVQDLSQATFTFSSTTLSTGASQECA